MCTTTLTTTTHKTDVNYSKKKPKSTEKNNFTFSVLPPNQAMAMLIQMMIMDGLMDDIMIYLHACSRLIFGYFYKKYS